MNSVPHDTLETLMEVNQSRLKSEAWACMHWGAVMWWYIDREKPPPTQSEHQKQKTTVPQEQSHTPVETRHCTPTALTICWCIHTNTAW